jgi:hypothetical protein
MSQILQPSIKDVFDSNYRRDYVIHKTAKVRNKFYNFKIWTQKLERIARGKPIGAQEGWVNLKVRRALRNKNGVPIDRDGKEIDVSDAKALEQRCVYPKDWYTIEDNKHNLLVTSGRDWVHAQLWTNTSAGTIAAYYIALTDDATGTDATDTQLPGELDNTNGLGRAASTPAHTPGATTSTLTKTWTATNAGDTGIQMAGACWHASTAATMALENTFTSTDLAVGDSLQLTWTITTS